MKRGIIALLDALGTKGIWARSDPQSVINAWKETLDMFELSLNRTKNQEIQHTFLAFSDTLIIILPIEDDIVSAIPYMAELLMTPFVWALTQGIFFRGVISIGEYEQSESMIIGPAIDEAAEWYTLPDWMGISLTPSASFGVDRLFEQGADLSRWFVRYNIPMKSGLNTINGWALAWPHGSFETINVSGKSISAKTLILNSFAKRPIGVGAYQKYKNTIDFWDYVHSLNENKK